jgi:hypothetical protein
LHAPQPEAHEELRRLEHAQPLQHTREIVLRQRDVFDLVFVDVTEQSAQHRLVERRLQLAKQMMREVLDEELHAEQLQPRIARAADAAKDTPREAIDRRQLTAERTEITLEHAHVFRLLEHLGCEHHADFELRHHGHELRGHLHRGELAIIDHRKKPAQRLALLF